MTKPAKLALVEAEKADVPAKQEADQPKPPAKRHKTTVREKAHGDAYFDRMKDFPPIPRILVEPDDEDVVHINNDHPDPTMGATMLAAAIGVPSNAFYQGVLKDLAAITNPTRDGAGRLNFSMAAVASIAPRDAVEAMLATQMAGIHQAIMDQSGRLLLPGQTMEGREAAEKALNRLARTYARQTEALKKYRSSGEQRVVVERVDVQAGGQAVVGTVNAGGRADGKSGQ